MAHQTTSSIVINAAPGAVMAVIADFDDYPSWAQGVKSAEVVDDGDDGRAREVHFELDASPIKKPFMGTVSWDGKIWAVEGKAGSKLERFRIALARTPGIVTRLFTDGEETEAVDERRRVGELMAERNAFAGESVRTSEVPLLPGHLGQIVEESGSPPRVARLACKLECLLGQV